jgi:hypothetical protein
MFLSVSERLELEATHSQPRVHAHQLCLARTIRL